MSGRRIPVAGPSITDREVEAVAEAARTAWYEHAGEPVAAFETAFADHVGRRWAMALPSCTAGLHLVLAALGIGPGDEVIVPDATWIASAAPITYVGARPVFVDVDPVTWCLDVDAVDRARTPATRAVIAVDLYGSMPDVDRLETWCRTHDVALVEDAAEALGSAVAGRPAGSFGTASTFSFHGSKTLTTGEGGMIVSDDRALMDRCDVLRDHGRRPGDVSFVNGEVAFKYKMSALQAALGGAQLERVDELVDAKRRIFAWYRERLGDIPGLALNAEPPGTTSSYWMTTLVLPDELGAGSADLAAHLARHQIDTRPFFHPLSSLPAYADHPQAATAPTTNPVSYRLGRLGLNLPSALSLTEDDVDVVGDEVRAWIADPTTR
ncbi:MAG: DegT/DnrJ/EryC1/StrS family aminotransferase [Acidimicrobiales bacterium]